MFSFLNKNSNMSILNIIIFLFSIKLIMFIFISFGVFEIQLGGGGDANYYHQYAIGSTDVSTSIWPIILAYLNKFNLYSREVISYIIFAINLIFIPLLLNKVAGLNFQRQQKIYLYSFLLISFYPTLYFYSFDIYRDVFMVFSFLAACLIVKKTLNNNHLFFIIGFIFALFFGYFLYELRPYLGYAFLGALFLWKIKFTKKRILIFGIIYLIVLFFANFLGFLDSLTEYRSSFEEGSGGSTLGLNFSNPVLFIPNFILSILGQLLGLYITNPMALILFFLETIPFIFMLKYIINNIKYADEFVRFLIIFFILYGSVWLIGNDNLGTAVRLRMFNYVAVYICFFYILRLKTQLRLH